MYSHIVILGLSLFLVSCHPWHKTVQDRYAWPSFRGHVSNLGVSPTSLSPPLILNKIWHFDHRIRATAAASEGRVFIADWNGVVYALDVMSEAVLWQQHTRRYITGSPLLYRDQVIIASCDSTVYAFSARNGRLRWQFRMQHLSISSPVGYRDLVIFGSHDGHVYALNARNGKRKWAFDTGGLVSSSPAVADGRVYIGSGKPGLFCLDAGSGRLIWAFKTEKGVIASPVVADGLVFFGDYAGWFYAVDLQGRLVWKTRGLKKIDASAAYLEGIVYWADMAGTVFAARGATGEPVWQFPLQGPVISSVLLDDRYLYTARYRPARLFMLDRFTGDLVWSFALEGNTYASPMIYRNRLFIGTEKGVFYAFRSAEPDTLLTEVHP